MTAPAASEPVLLGVRHHGPGSAHAVRAALELLRPRTVLIEGPPEADPLLPLAADPGMVPPVALLAYAVDEPSQAAFWPFAEFSPEWAALRWALAAGADVVFADLPAAQGFALGADAAQRAVRDPIAELAAAAGYDDAERWWEDAVELRAPDPADPLALFRAAAEAMAEVRGGPAGDRAAVPPGPDGAGPEEPGTDWEALREAHMRRRLRAAVRGAKGPVAVVCGAWHVPALDLRTHPEAADRELLRGLPRVRTAVAWVPWSHRRLGLDSGYGAGVPAPGWYRHLFRTPDRPLVHWTARAAALLRAEGVPVSAAQVIEAVRLAEALAVLRGRPAAGLEESLDALRAVCCEGSDVPLALVRDRLVVGDSLGRVPDAAPAAPLQRDLTRLQRTLRLRPEAAERRLELDLREPVGAARSRLLHRLRLLGVEWGQPVPEAGGTGTFREAWRLRWEPELSVRIAEAGLWGTTVRDAATARARDAAAHTASLAETTGLAEQCLLADLPGALPVVLRVLGDRAALDADVAHLAEALPALVRTLRYGDVRGTGGEAVRVLAEGLAVRVCVGLPPACAALDPEAAAAMRGHLDEVHRAIGLLAPAPAPGSDAGRPELRERWMRTLRTLAGRQDVPGLLRGRAVRLLVDGEDTRDGQYAQDTQDTGDTRDGRDRSRPGCAVAEHSSPDAAAPAPASADRDRRPGPAGAAPLDAAHEMSLALSPAAPPLDAAGWIEGFLSGGVLLVHDLRLLGLVDAWLTGVPERVFTDVLPLLRRTFAGFEAGVRRSVGERVREGLRPHGAGLYGAVPDGPEVLDGARADAVLPVLGLLLGRAVHPPAPAGGAAPAPPRPPEPADGAASAAGQAERLRRWRLVLGGEADGTGHRPAGRDAGMDRALARLYGAEQSRRGGLAGSSPQVARWLGDVRRYFSAGVVHLLQRDAVERLGLARLLLEPEALAAVEPDVHLVATLVSLGRALPEETRVSARAVVRQVAEDLERRLASRTRAVLGGALARDARSRRPRPQDIDWQRTIRANLAHYLPEQRTVVPRRLVGHSRTRRALGKELILCVDQSGSMAASLVHAAVFAAVLASVRTLRTRMVVFDTSVVDLTDRLADPVDVLLGVRLGGGTDIGRALAYCSGLVERPSDTLLVLVSDLHDGGSRERLLSRAAALRRAGVRMLVLLALSDEGAPAYDRETAAALAALDIPAFACGPDRFPEVVAEALR